MLLVAACGSGGDADDDVSTSTDVAARVGSEDEPAATTTDPPRSGDSVRSVVRSADGDLTLTVESSVAEIWMTTTRADICSPGEPAVAVFEAELAGSAASDVTGMRAVFRPSDGADDDDESDEHESDDRDGDGEDDEDGDDQPAAQDEDVDDVDSPSGTRTIDFAVDEDGTWRAVVGPFVARSPDDRPLDVTVMARTDDGVSARAELELIARAPVRCGSGERPDRTRRTPPPVELDVTTTPSDGRIVGTGAEDCAGRPSVLGVQIDASGAVVAMAATLTLPDGSMVNRSFGGRGSRVVDASLGPFAAPAGDAAVARLVVSATDVYGTTVERSATVTLLRPVPCDDPTATSTTISGDDEGDDGDSDGATDDRLTVAFTPDPPLVWATGTGRCPAGPTTLAVSIVAPAAVESVSVAARTANGQTVTSSLSESGGTWQGVIGPFAGWGGMPANSDLGIRITASGGGQNRTVDETARLRRSDACGTATTAPVTTAPSTTNPSTTVAGTSPPTTAAATTAPPTTSPPTTAAPTTAPPTTAPPTTSPPTTQPPPPPPGLTAVGANPNPVACGASVTIGAQTSGTVDRVGVSFGGANRQMSGGGGQWTLGATAPGTAGSYPVSVTAQGAGQSASSSFSLTVTC